MRTISLSENLDDYKTIFEELARSKDNLVAWQIQDGERIIKVSHIHSFNLETVEFTADISKENNNDFISDEVYFFAKSKNLIFKTSLLSAKDSMKSYKLPKEIKKLDEAETPSWMKQIDFDNLNVFVKGYGFANVPKETTRVKGEGRANIKEQTHMRYNSNNATERISTKWRMNSMSEHDSELFETELSFVNLDEEDRLYAEQRSAPRARPSKDKMICVQVGDRSIGEMFSLFDLSQGGLGFITTEKDKFEIDQKINVLGFDEKHFDTPMVVVVKAIRDTDDSGFVFKVGCAFQG